MMDEEEFQFTDSAVLRKMELYTALFSSAIQFNSVVFRVVVGVLSGSFLHAVATITAIEFTLNSILEIPGGILADRVGRIPCAIAGLAFIAAALSCMYVAILMGPLSSWSTALVVIDGILLGGGKPLLSGSVEAFYQDALSRAKKANPVDSSAHAHSFTLSQKHGKFIPAAVAIICFPLLYVLNRTIGAEHAFLVGISLYLLIIVRLAKDHVAFGRGRKKETPSHFLFIVGQFLKNREMRFTAFINLIFYMVACIVMGYLVVGLGRKYSSVESNFYWWAMAAFMGGYLTLGWTANAILLPRLIGKVSEKAYLLTFLIALFLSSVAMFFLENRIPPVFLTGFLFLFGALFLVSTSAIRAVATNRLLAEVKRKDYATALSIQCLPAFAGVGLHSFLVNKFTSGAPSVGVTFLGAASVALAGIIGSAIYFQSPAFGRKQLT